MSNSDLVISNFTKQILFYVFNFLAFFFSILHPCPEECSLGFSIFPACFSFSQFLLQLLTEILLHAKVFLGNLNLDEPSA